MWQLKIFINQGVIMNIKWTTEESNFLKGNLFKLSIKEMAETLNKTEKSIRRKLDRMGINKGARTEWTQQDQNFLEEHLHLPISEVIKLMPRFKQSTVIKRFYKTKNQKKLEERKI